jgi:hypothetical protein
VIDDRSELLAGLPGARPISAVMHDPVPGFLFENCFRDHSITVFVAPSHRGKTLLLLDMALCLDMEMPLFGRFQPLAGRQVFFMGCDAPSWDYGLQARKLCIGHGIPPAQRELLGLAGVWRSGVKITDPSVREWLSQWKEHTNTDVLFIDSHRATHGANENDSGEMTKVWDILKGMRDKGWCIIMAHHAGHEREIAGADVHSGRGSTVINDASDFIYTLNKRNRKDTRVKVACVKGRGAAEDDDPFSFFDIVSVASDEIVNGRPLYGLKLVAPAEDAMLVIEAALAAGPCDRKALQELVRAKCPEFVKGMADITLYRFLDNRLQELRQLGKAKIVERGLWGKA